MADSRIPHVDRRSFVAPVLVFVAVVVFFSLPGLPGEALDLWIQSSFWNGKDWLIPHENALGLAIAYDGPKALIIIWALLLIGAAIFAKRVRVVPYISSPASRWSRSSVRNFGRSPVWLHPWN